MKNIGDAAICSVALNLLDQILDNKGILYGMFTDNKENIKRYNVKSRLYSLSSPYGIAIASDGKPIGSLQKIIRFIHIITKSVNVLLFKIDQKHYAYIKALRESDGVIGMGGGYLRTKEKYRDFFGLLLTLLPLYIAKLYKKPVIFLPMSFGNFASTLHKRIAYHALQKTTILCRDMITYQELKSMDRGDLRYMFAPDLALFYDVSPKIDSNKKYTNNYLVLTAREWLKKDEQMKYEQALIELIKHAWKKYHLKTYFVAMAGNKAEDDDNRVAQRIEAAINDNNIFAITPLNHPKEVQNFLNNAKVAICTRMHSAILAITVGTPFLTIGYEHKTKGLMKHMNLSSWHMDIEKVRKNILIDKFDRLLDKKNYNFFHKKFGAET